MKKSSSQYSNTNMILSIILFLFVVVGVVGCLVYDGTINVPFYKFKKTTVKFERRPVFEVPLMSYAYFNPITINFVEYNFDGNTSNIIVQAGAGHNLKEYTIVVDDQFEKVSEGKFAVKTNDTYVPIEGTDYYLYAYFENNDTILATVGLAK